MTMMMMMVMMLVLAWLEAPARADEATIPQGALRASLDLEMTRSTRNANSPWFAAPDVHFGATSRLTVGIAHSTRSLGLVATGGGVCVRDCDERHGQGGLDARYLVHRYGDVTVSARAMLFVRRVDPFHTALLVSARADWERGRWSVSAAPHLAFGLSQRDAGNGSTFNLPVLTGVRIGRVQPYLLVAVETPVHEARERFDVPLALGLRVRVSDAAEVGVQYGLRRPIGPLNTAKDRDALVFASWRSQIL